MGTVATSSLFNNLNDFEAADGGERLIRVQCVESQRLRRLSARVAPDNVAGLLLAQPDLIVSSPASAVFLTCQRPHMKEYICSGHEMIRFN